MIYQWFTRKGKTWKNTSPLHSKLHLHPGPWQRHAGISTVIPDAMHRLTPAPSQPCGAVAPLSKVSIFHAKGVEGFTINLFLTSVSNEDIDSIQSSPVEPGLPLCKIIPRIAVTEGDNIVKVADRNCPVARDSFFYTWPLFGYLNLMSTSSVPGKGHVAHVPQVPCGTIGQINATCGSHLHFLIWHHEVKA